MLRKPPGSHRALITFFSDRNSPNMTCDNQDADQSRTDFVPGCNRLPASDSPDENQGAGNSCSALAVSLPCDPELTRVMDAWPTLPAAHRTGILAMIEAA